MRNGIVLTVVCFALLLSSTLWIEQRPVLKAEVSYFPSTVVDNGSAVWWINTVRQNGEKVTTGDTLIRFTQLTPGDDMPTNNGQIQKVRAPGRNTFVTKDSSIISTREGFWISPESIAPGQSLQAREFQYLVVPETEARVYIKLLKPQAPIAPGSPVALKTAEGKMLKASFTGVLEDGTWQLLLADFAPELLRSAPVELLLEPVPLFYSFVKL